MRSFPRFAGIGGAREFAENLAAELTQGSQVPFLSPKQAQDALAIRDLLADLQRETGRRVSAVEAVIGFLAAATPVPVRTVTADAAPPRQTRPPVTQPILMAEEVISAKPVSTSNTARKSSTEERLPKLAELRQRGLISEEELAEKRRQILSES